MRTALPVLLVVLLGDSSGGIEVSSDKEEEGRGHDGGLTGSSAEDTASKIRNEALHDGLSKRRHSVGNVALNDLGRVEGAILARSGVALRFDPVHGYKME